jgi:Transposase IS200 like
MPRKARIVIPGVAHHVIQCGHNRQMVFAIEEDFQCYLQNLVELKNAFGAKLYAYCLMTNHVHLLLVAARPKGLGVCRTFTRHVLSSQAKRAVWWGISTALQSLSTLNNILAATSAAFFTPFRVCKRFRLKAMQTSVHSPCTAFKPRNRKCRNPITCLITRLFHIATTQT